MRRENNHDESEAGHERWLVSYADFITLMFAFFAVLYATSHKDFEKSKEFEESIKKFLIKAAVTGGGTGPGAQVSAGERGDTPIEPPIAAFRRESADAATKVDEAEAELEAKLSKAERARYVTDITADDWGVRVVLPAAELFAPGSERFREDAIPFVGKLAAWIGASKRKILIEGHVASGETGAQKSTWDFASGRAVNMLRFVQKKANLPGDRLAAMSLADTRPLAAKAELNSRLEIVILNEDREL